MARATYLDPSQPWELRRPDLYSMAPGGCPWCFTHVDPAAIWKHSDFRRWLTVYAPWKREHSFRHDYPCPTTDPGSSAWETIRRWANGSAASFSAVDKVWCRLGWVLEPWATFAPAARLVRRDLYWSPEREQSMAVRIAFAHAMGSAADAVRELSGEVPHLAPPPYGRFDDWEKLLLNEGASDAGASGHCICGGGVPLSGDSARRARAARSRRRARRAGASGGGAVLHSPARHPRGHVGGEGR